MGQIHEYQHLGAVDPDFAIPETPHACLCEAWRLQERRQRYERERARRSPDIAKLDRRIDGCYG